MNKSLKVTLIVLASILLLVAIIGFSGWLYVKSTYLNFEKNYIENLDIKEITLDDYSFLDRNGNNKLDIYEDDRRSTKERIGDLLAQMTTDEKLHLLKGSGIASAMGMGVPGEGVPGAVGTIVPTPRLGIPTVYLSDGPAGLRIEPKRENEDRTYYATAFPIGTSLASTWNVGLVEEVGTAMGDEALEYGIDVILGPGANIHRHPLTGRNFEYFSEDPLLTGYIGAAMVNGIESKGVGTSVKHYVANNQETDRMINDVIISERALREIYLKGFEIIVAKSQPWTIMSSYNKVNGTYASESKKLLTDILRDEWGFEGLVMTDWFGRDDAPSQVKAGNDLLEPGTKKQWNALIEAEENGDLSMDEIDIAVKRILKLILESQKMKGYENKDNPDLTAHAKVTRQSAAEGMVLLKNENALPLQSSKNVALLGITSYDFIAGGTGSGDVNEAYTVSLEEGLMNAGLTIDEVAKSAFEKHKAANEKLFIKPEGIQNMLKPFAPPEMELTAELLQQCAGTADVAIITIGRNGGEGGDRVEKDDFLLAEKEQKMIANTCEAFHNVGKKVIVVMNIGGVIETASWKEQPDAILLAWQGGQEGGNSAADILVGNVNPSGKLPMTFPIHLADHAANANFPLDGKPFDPKQIFLSLKAKSEKDKVKNEDYTLYEEGIYVGYRHFDKANIDVSYPFGYGLSYANFEHSDLAVALENDAIQLSVIVKNIGNRSGKEVVQVYVSKDDSAIDRPVQELKAFVKTGSLQPEESTEVILDLPITEFRYWDEDKSSWSLETGTYSIRVGASSRDIRAVKEIVL